MEIYLQARPSAECLIRYKGLPYIYGHARQALFCQNVFEVLVWEKTTTGSLRHISGKFQNHEILPKRICIFLFSPKIFLKPTKIKRCKHPNSKKNSCYIFLRMLKGQYLIKSESIFVKRLCCLSYFLALFHEKFRFFWGATPHAPSTDPLPSFIPLYSRVISESLNIRIVIHCSIVFFKIRILYSKIWFRLYSFTAIWMLIFFE